MRKYSMGAHRVHYSVQLVVTLFILLGFLFPNVAGTAYMSLLMEPNTTITSPPIVLQEGTAGNSTIYTNSTSAKVSVEPPGTDTEDYVDNNMSDVDLGADIGIHSNFTAQKYGPDLISDTLTEEDTGGTSDVFTDGFEDQTFNKWDDNEATVWQIVSTYAHGGTYSAESQSTHQGDLVSDDIDLSGATSAGFECWTYATAVDSNEFLLYFYNGTSYNLISDLDVGDDVWNYHSYAIDSQYFVSNFRIRFYTTALGVPQDVYVDDANVNKTIANYELDLEVQWTSVDFDEPNEELCIYGGTMGAENITIDVWNGSDWENLSTDMNSGWNNISVTSYLTASNFTIRFKGSVETGDITKNTWDIDATLLHIWTEAGIGDFNYVLNMTENHGSNWKVRLKAYDNSSITRLSNCSIYIYDGSNSTQIVILSGAYENQTGPWYDLAALDVEYIWVHVETSSAGTSYVYTYLEIRVPPTTTYARYIITFEIA